MTGAASGANRPDLLLENDGTGSQFWSVPTPLAGGDGQSVAAVDHDGDGAPSLIVMNGFKAVAGPVQFLTLRAADARSSVR